MAEDTPPPPPPPNPAAAGSSNDGPRPNEGQGAHVDLANDRSEAKGTGTSALGDQVRPETMLNEADGNRTLMNPRTDPGPYHPPGSPGIVPPDRSKGEHRYSDNNDPIHVTMRTSTGHALGFGRPGGEVLTEQPIAPDIFASGAASEQYHPEGGATLTEQAQANAAKPREMAVQSE